MRHEIFFPLTHTHTFLIFLFLTLSISLCVYFAGLHLRSIEEPQSRMPTEQGGTVGLDATLGSRAGVPLPLQLPPHSNLHHHHPHHNHHSHHHANSSSSSGDNKLHFTGFASTHRAFVFGVQFSGSCAHASNAIRSYFLILGRMNKKKGKTTQRENNSSIEPQTFLATKRYFIGMTKFDPCKIISATFSRCYR